jgi:hypothetical protein
MAQIFNIQNDKVVIDKLTLGTLDGSIIHNGSQVINGDESISGNLVVRGKIVVDVIQANQIINNNISGTVGEGSNKFLGTDENALNGQGIAWSTLNSESQLVYKPGNRLWTNMNLDLEAGNSYKLNGIDVLTNNTLGSGIARSSLRQLGPLNNLTVVGNTTIGDFAFFDTDTNRIGFGTESPNATFGLVDNNVEIVMGSPEAGIASFGTYTNHDLTLITDNIPRITVKHNGDVHFGSTHNASMNMYVHGTFYADTIVSDSRTETNTSVEFKAAGDVSVYGMGLIWSGTGSPKQLIMRSGPDRLWSTEHLEIHTGKSLWINDKVVLSETSLGDSVISSKLSTVGILNTLDVAGETRLNDVIANGVSLTKLSFTKGSEVMTFDANAIDTNLDFDVTIAGHGALHIDSNNINLGTSSTTGRQIRLFGNVSINVNNPDPTLNLAVAGNFGFAGRKFVTGSEAPIHGTFALGDTCWNTNPNIGGYMGWVCIVAGTPGQWAPFGLIG